MNEGKDSYLQCHFKIARAEIPRGITITLFIEIVDKDFWIYEVENIRWGYMIDDD